jgi:hypothetical protein
LEEPAFRKASPPLSHKDEPPDTRADPGTLLPELPADKDASPPRPEGEEPPSIVIEPDSLVDSPLDMRMFPELSAFPLPIEMSPEEPFGASPVFRMMSPLSFSYVAPNVCMAMDLVFSSDTGRVWKRLVCD